MSDFTINVGSKFKGISKGKITVGGSSTVENVEVVEAQKATINVGFELEGDQEGTSEIIDNEVKKVTNVKQKKVNEQKSEIAAGSVLDGNLTNVDKANTATNVKQENVDRPTESSPLQTNPPVAVVRPRLAKVEPSQIPRIGSTVVSKAKELGFRIKGHVSIFNQEFKNTKDFRDGSANDVEYLKETFERFAIEPVVKLDLKYKDIVNEITLLSTEDFSTYKLFVCIYMSHGNRNGMVRAADKEFNLKKIIIDRIMGNSTLNGILKIFVTVACRGPDNYEECDIEEFDGRILSTADGIDYSNCIFSYSTYEGHVSKRTRNGTYFIQYLCDNINEDNGDTKILSIFAKVNGILADMYKQVPVFKTTMADISFRDLRFTSSM